MTAVNEQIAYESRVKARQALIAGVAGILLVAAAAVQITGVHTKVDELTLDLITEHRRFPLDLIGAIINAFGLVALAGTLNYLFEITRARNAEIQPWIRWLAVVGGVLSGIAAIVYAVVISHKADEFVSHGAQTYPQANALTSGGLIVALPLIAQLASLLLTGGFIWISLNAMRVGLLTRFMGYLGIFAGVLVLFPIGSPVPVVQGFWLLALAYLLTGRWPSGVPAAWSSGLMVPWPSSADLREQRERERGMSPRQKARADQKAARPTPKVVSSTATDVDDAGSGAGADKRTGTASPSTSAAKRKKKRRR
jgi:hypothetical protein